jgi:hypothetical protein
VRCSFHQIRGEDIAAFRMHRHVGKHIRNCVGRV